MHWCCLHFFLLPGHLTLECPLGQWSCTSCCHTIPPSFWLPSRNFIQLLMAVDVGAAAYKGRALVTVLGLPVIFSSSSGISVMSLKSHSHFGSMSRIHCLKTGPQDSYPFKLTISLYISIYFIYFFVVLWMESRTWWPGSCLTTRVHSLVIIFDNWDIL